MGDPACWLQYVCEGCGRFLEAVDPADPVCPHCGAEVEERTAPPSR